MITNLKINIYSKVKGYQFHLCPWIFIQWLLSYNIVLFVYGRRSHGRRLPRLFWIYKNPRYILACSPRGLIIEYSDWYSVLA